MSTITKDLGAVTAYAYAKEKGYTGTEAEFAELMASYATVAEQASQSAQTATEKASEASQSASDAQTAKTASETAQGIAESARDDAESARDEAQQSATTASQKAQEASQSAQTASKKASEASQSATDAQIAKTASETAQASAESARDDTESARDTASQSAQTASEKAQQASASATSASQSASSASASAQTAQTAQQTATAKASEAQQSAQTATEKASEASQSASESSQSAQTAVQAKQDAQTAKTASETAQASAESARDDAESARDEAQQYAESIDPEKLIGAYSVDTASGSIASFTDGADNIPMKSVKVRIEPVQDLHGQDAPYPAGGGKNLLETTATSKTENGITFTVNSDGSVLVNGTATEQANFLVNPDGNLIPAGTQITVSGCPANGGMDTYSFWATKQTYVENGNGITFTPSEDVYIIGRIRIAKGCVCNNLLFKPQVEKGSAKTSWSPYSNICPITGWTGATVTRTGKNLIDYTSPNTHDYNISYSNGVYTASDGDTASTLRLKLQQRNASFANIGSAQIEKTVITSPTTIYMTTIIQEGAYTLRFSNSGSTREFTKCFDISHLKPGMEVTFSVNLIDMTIGAIKFKDCQLEFGSIASNYTPFTGSSTYPITFPTEAGTVYGGTLDVVSGELVVTHASKTFDGTENWFEYKVYEGYSCGIEEMKKGLRQDGKSNMLVNSKTTATAQKNAMWLGVDSRIFYAIGVYESMGSTLDTFKAFLAGHNLVITYPLETPITLTLTPTEIRSLLGDNNIWADAGESTVIYRADTTMYINRKIAEAVSALS